MGNLNNALQELRAERKQARELPVEHLRRAVDVPVRQIEERPALEIVDQRSKPASRALARTSLEVPAAAAT